MASISLRTGDASISLVPEICDLMRFNLSERSLSGLEANSSWGRILSNSLYYLREAYRDDLFWLESSLFKATCVASSAWSVIRRQSVVIFPSGSCLFSFFWWSGWILRKQPQTQHSSPQTIPRKQIYLLMFWTRINSSEEGLTSGLRKNLTTESKRIRASDLRPSGKYFITALIAFRSYGYWLFNAET